MANGIEHRSIDQVLGAYEDYEMPNFTVWNGKRLVVTYDGDNIDEGRQTLLQYLNMINTAGTAAVYLLKVYPEGCGRINSKTEYNGSCTFMLSPNMGVVPAGGGGMAGIQVFDSGGRNTPAAGKEFISRLDKLEAENKALLDKLHTEQLNGIRRDFTAQIAGLQKVEEEKSGLDRLFDFLDKKPEMIDKLFDGVHKIAGIFRERKDYIVNQPAGGSLAGTNHKSQDPAEPGEENPDDMETSDMQVTSEGALINPLLTDEERKLKKSEQGKILITRLEPLTQDNHDDLQSECLEIIEKRVGAVTLSRMLLAVASLDNDDLNKLLNNLD